MARYIDANELQKRLTQIAGEPDYLHEGDTWDTGVNLAGVQVDLMPTSDVEEVIHAKWEINSDGYYPYCSHCKTEPKNGVMSKRCPECGAKMDGGEAE